MSLFSYLTANTLAELICLLFAVFCLRTDKQLIWRSQIIYLLITCLTEFLGIYVSHHKNNNQWVYNIFILFEAGFTYLMFFELLKKHVNCKPIIISGLVIFLVLYLFGIINSGFSVYVYATYVGLSVEFVLLSLYYYYLLLKDDRYVELKFSPAFWWVTGTLFFYFVSTACDLFDEKLYSIMITAFHQHLTYFIFKALNIILYSCWSYSFICKKWLTTTSKA